MNLTPLESNPEVMNKFLEKLGVSEKWCITDVLGLDEELLGMLPKPVLALILLYPMSEKIEQYKGELEKKPVDGDKIKNDGVYHMKQMVSNACGTIALIHSIVNNTDSIDLKDNFLKEFLEKSQSLNYEMRGELFCKSDEILQAHAALSQEGQSEAPGENQPSNHHFIALVNRNGTLYELDGRMSHPVDHGSTTDESFLQNAAKICKQYMAREPTETRFTVVALVPKEDLAN